LHGLGGAGARSDSRAVPLSEVTERRRHRRLPDGAGDDLPHALPEKRSDETAPVMLENLKRLDSVIHDFLACLDQMNLRNPLEGTRSEQVARFMRILDYVPSNSGPLLGPPVLCGMSPPMALESLFGFLGSLHKTGILRIRADDVIFMISIVKGDVVHGVCHPRPEGELLGNILVARGAIDADRLGRFFEQCGSSACKIGEALNRQELVSTEELREALEFQLQQLFDRLLAARASEWCFHEGEATLSYIRMRMNATSVLLESARKRDEENVA
jgi:hypothetical protein